MAAEKGNGLSHLLATHLSRVWALAPVDLSPCPLTLLHLGDSWIAPLLLLDNSVP